MSVVTSEPRTSSDAGPSTRERRLALSVTTIGILSVTLNSSILLISLPAIFNGLGLDPLEPANISYLLWMLMGFMLVTAVLVVTFGRLGDLYGRAKLFNLGFAIFTLGALGCALVPSSGAAGALEIIALRILQGVGGSMVMANSTALITDAYPAERRGFALGINQVAAMAGGFLGLVVGGLLAEWDWRAVFWVSVPFGLWGTVMGYRTLHDKPRDRGAKVRIDWWGNLTFGVGLIVLLVGIIYGLQPYGGHTMGWTNPLVLGCVIAGVVLLVAFVFVELHVVDPMIDMRLFKIRPFAAGQLVNFLASMSRGGLQFMLIIWLQGIWLPLHGYSFESTPLWAGIYMLPLTVGFLIAGPISGALSDRFGAKLFASGGLALSTLTFVGLIFLPADFNYLLFGGLLAANGIGLGLMTSPNTAAVMNSVPARQRGAASGIRATGLNAGQVLSMGAFFTMMAVGLAGALPAALRSGLTGAGVSAQAADSASHLPPVGALFAAFLGKNPLDGLQKDGTLPSHGAVAQRIDDTSFFPHLLSSPFMHGLAIAFTASIVMLLIAIGASLMRGGKYVHLDADGSEHHDGVLEAIVREGEGLTAVPSEDVAFDDVMAGRKVGAGDLRD